MKALIALVSLWSAAGWAGTFDKTEVRSQITTCELSNVENTSERFVLSMKITEQTERAGTVFRNKIEVAPFVLPYSIPKDANAPGSVDFSKGAQVRLEHSPENWVGYGPSSEESWSKLFVGGGEGNFPREISAVTGFALASEALKVMPFHREDASLVVQFGFLDHLGRFFPHHEFAGNCLTH